VQFRRPLGNRQSQAATACLGGEERLEHLIANLQRNARSAVPHREHDRVMPWYQRDVDPSVTAHGLRGVDQQIEDGCPDHLGVGFDRGFLIVDGDLDVLGNRIPPHHRDRVQDQRAERDVTKSQRPRTGKDHDVVDQLAERVDATDDVAHDRQLTVSAGAAGHQDLHRPLDAGERVADLVCHDRSHLSEPCQGRLLRQLFLGSLPGSNVRPDGDVLIRLPALIEERDDGRVHPVVVTVLGAIPDFAVPDLAVCDRPPEIAHELLRVIVRVDDAVVLADQFVARIPGNLAKLVVDISDDPRDVGDRHDRRVVQRAFQVLEARCICHRNPQ